MTRTRMWTWMSMMAAGAMLAAAWNVSIAADKPAKPAPADKAAKPAAPKVKEAADQPAPRSGNWMQKHEALLAKAKTGGIELYFLGDSITAGWNDNAVWKKHYTSLKAGNFGIGGDRTQHLLWRLDNGEFDGLTPKVVVLMIGTNNASAGNTSEEIAGGIQAIIKKIQGKSPSTKVLLLGIFPRGKDASDTRRKVNDGVNALIAKYDNGKSVRYLNFGDKLMNADGTISKEIMPDLLHLSVKGYQIWADAMQPLLEEMMK